MGVCLLGMLTCVSVCHSACLDLSKIKARYYFISQKSIIRFHCQCQVAFSIFPHPKCNTGLDRKSAHPLLFNTRKQGHCTATSPGGTFTCSGTCLTFRVGRFHIKSSIGLTDRAYQVLFTSFRARCHPKILDCLMFS